MCLYLPPAPIEAFTGRHSRKRHINTVIPALYMPLQGAQKVEAYNRLMLLRLLAQVHKNVA